MQVVAYDFGIKHNILRRLASYGCKIIVVPATYPASKVLEMNPDGVFFSNGPVSYFGMMTELCMHTRLSTGLLCAPCMLSHIGHPCTRLIVSGTSIVINHPLQSGTIWDGPVYVHQAYSYAGLCRGLLHHAAVVHSLTHHHLPHVHCLAG